MDPKTPKYLIANADEGEPGTFKDRFILEGDPHLLIEGMIIAGYAIGAERGYIYLRREYPLAAEILERAIAQAYEKRLLGDAIPGKGVRFHLSVHQGAGAYICGEETSLIESLEGRRGNPRLRPPFPANAGAWGKPTVVNNVETLANIPYVLSLGSATYAEDRRRIRARHQDLLRERHREPAGRIRTPARHEPPRYHLHLRGRHQAKAGVSRPSSRAGPRRPCSPQSSLTLKWTSIRCCPRDPCSGPGR